MVEGIYRLFDSIWRLSLVGSYCILLVILARFLLKKARMVFLSAVGNRICAVMLSGAAGDQDQSDPGASVDRRTATTSAQLLPGTVPDQLTMREFIMAATVETILWMPCCPGRIIREI